MELKINKFDIKGVHQFLEEEGNKKTIYNRNCLRRGTWTIQEGVGKKKGKECF